MNFSKKIKLCFVGPSGSGKSTCARLMADQLSIIGYTCGIYKLAKPLYDLQKAFFEIADIELRPGAQDQLLLESIAIHLRRLSKNSLINNFNKLLCGAQEDIIINDDLRDVDVDLSSFIDQNFIIIRVFSNDDIRRERLSIRNDPSIILDSKLDANIRKIRANYTIVNNESIDELNIHIGYLMKSILNGRLLKVA